MADSATRGALPGLHCKQAAAAAEGLKVLKGHAVAINEAWELRKCEGLF